MDAVNKNKWSVIINAILTITTAILNGFGFTIN